MVSLHSLKYPAIGRSRHEHRHTEGIALLLVPKLNHRFITHIILTLVLLHTQVALVSRVELCHVQRRYTMVDTAISGRIALLQVGQIQRLAHLSFLKQGTIARCRHLRHLVFHRIDPCLILTRLVVRTDADAPAVAEDGGGVRLTMYDCLRTFLLRQVEGVIDYIRSVIAL